MSSSDFFFALARISCAQIFRSAGIDRCSPSTLDTVTDLLLRHLDLLATRASKLAKLSGRSEVTVSDLALAMEQVGLIKPFALLDEFDIDPNGVIGMERFIEWSKGPVPAEARRISRISQAQSGATGANSSAAAAVAAQAAVVAAAAQKMDVDDPSAASAAALTSSSNDNSTTLTAATSTSATTKNTNDDDLLNAEWLTTLMKKQVKVGHETKFKGTVLGDDNVHNDTAPVGPTPAAFADW